MRTVLVGLLWRLSIGVGIALVGLISAMISQNWAVEYRWFSAFGFLCVVVGFLPFMSGSRIGEMRAKSFLKPASKENKVETYSVANLFTTMVVIGLINMSVPIIVYYTVS